MSVWYWVYEKDGSENITKVPFFFHSPFSASTHPHIPCTEEELGRRKGGSSFVTCFRFSQAWGMDAKEIMPGAIVWKKSSHWFHGSPDKYYPLKTQLVVWNCIDPAENLMFSHELNLISWVLANESQKRPPISSKLAHWTGILMPFGPYLREVCIGWKMSGLRSPRRSLDERRWHGHWTGS